MAALLGVSCEPGVNLAISRDGYVFDLECSSLGRACPQFREIGGMHRQRQPALLLGGATGQWRALR
jgi:hypothetical protein